MLRVYNSLTRQIEDFIPLKDGEVRMYNCGPTVYSSPHIGNFRSFLLPDLLRRYLEWRGFRVLQIMNLTDVGHLTDDEHEAGEDKMEAGARAQRKTVWELAEQYIQEFFEAARYVNLKPAMLYPRATDHIAEMIEIARVLVERGHAYVAATGNVYFEVATFPRYGALSGNKADDLLAGARIEVNPEKKDPRDFALWKIDPKHQMQWDSPWGRGFPGWHIECSAMARKYLGQPLDVHTGGEDNVFPHHECEIAQSEASDGAPFVRYWLHVRHLLVDGRKMAKREGNFFTVDDVRRRGAPGDALRLALQRSHYREPLNFTLGALDETTRKVERYAELKERLQAGAAAGGGSQSRELAAEIADARTLFQQSLDDDLNVSGALRELDRLVTTGFRSELRGADAAALQSALADFWGVFGLLESTAASDAAVDPEVQRLVDERQQARARKDWKESDRLRDVIRERGYEVIDGKDGVKVKRVGTG